MIVFFGLVYCGWNRDGAWSGLSGPHCVLLLLWHVWCSGTRSKYWDLFKALISQTMTPSAGWDDLCTIFPSSFLLSPFLIPSIIGAVEGELSSGGVQLVIGDLSSLPFGSHPPGYEEHHTKQQLLSQCICALKVCEDTPAIVRLAIHVDTHSFICSNLAQPAVIVWVVYWTNGVPYGLTHIIRLHDT